MKIKEPIWITNLQSMYQRQDMDKIPENYSPLTVNISNDKPGTWAKRKGSQLLGASKSGKIQGLINYYRQDGTIQIRAIRDRNLDNYDVGSDTWSTLSANEFASNVSVRSVNYKGRLYHVSTGDNLCSEDGSGATVDVGSAGNEIRGNCLGVAQNTLFIGDINYIQSMGNVTYPDRVYYSVFDLNNNTPGDQLFNTGETTATSTRWFTLNEKCTALFSFGITGLMYCFTANKCYVFDIEKEDTAYGVVPVFDIGCANPDSITTCNGMMIWMDYDGRIWAWGGAGTPLEVSWEIEDDENGEAIINALSATNIASTCAGADKNKFFFSVGTITYRNETIENAWIKGLMSQNSRVILLSVDSYPYPVSIMETAVLNNKKALLYATSNYSDVYRVGIGSSDERTAISCSAKTKFFDFGEPLKTKEFTELYIKYKPQDTTDTYIKIRYAIDGKYEYVTISDPIPLTGKVTEYGIINTYDGDAPLATDAIKVISFPTDARGRSISIEISNNQEDKKIEVTGIGFNFEYKDLDLRPESYQE